jgi:GNAT superfamily N-acetyltransferase
VITYEWRGHFDNAAVSALHAEGFSHQIVDDDWQARLAQHSLGWVCAWDGHDLVGFVNVAWDGGVHAFLLDTLVSARKRRQGVGTRLVAIAVENARTAGCEWLHADFAGHLGPFYFGSCRFAATDAGLIALTGPGPAGTFACRPRQVS